MQKLLFSLFLFSFPLLAIAGGEPVMLEFYKGDLSKVQEVAKNSGKLYFYQFDAEWCTACRELREKTFADPVLVNYLADNYIAVNVDIDDLDGFAAKERLRVQKMPTIVIFGADGKMLDSLSDFSNAEKLLGTFKKWRTNPTSTAESAAPKQVRETSVPVAKSYDEAPPSAPVEGFAIQMLTLSTYEQAQRSREEMVKNHSDQPVFILESRDANGKKIFKILLGAFTSKDRAEQYRKSKAPKGFIKDLSTL